MSAAKTASIRYQPLRSLQYSTLPALFLGGVQAHGEMPALSAKVAGTLRQISYTEAAERVSYLAGALAELGVRKEARVAILSENRPEWAIADYAILMLGAICVPVYATLPANQIGHILNDSGAEVVFVSDAGQLEKLEEIRAAIPQIKTIIRFEGSASAGVLSLTDLQEQARRSGARVDLKACAAKVAPDDTATLIYTSGTTGAPKGVALSHLNLAGMVVATDQHGSCNVTRGDRAISMLPLSHIFERAIDYYYWMMGVEIFYAESIQKVQENLREMKPHMIVSVPRLYEKIYAAVMGATGAKGKLVRWAAAVGEQKLHEGNRAGAILEMQFRLADKLVFSKVRDAVGGRMKTLIAGGAPLAKEVTRFFHAAGLPIMEGYGLSETSPVITANRPQDLRFGTVGVPYPGVELRISDSGEILTRGPFLMKGYWNQPELTREVIDEEGWFHTGDIGRIDEDGFLQITDRIKDIIVTAGGKNIAPQPIEQQVIRSPYISEAVMIGDRRPYPILLIVPDWENIKRWARGQGISVEDHARAVTDKRIYSFLETEAMARLEEFARYELPKKLLVLEEGFSIELGTLTPSLKVRRHIIEQRYKSQIERTYAE